jgi:Domain of unknown function (DUF927)
MSSDDDTRPDEQLPLTSGDGNGRALVKHKSEPRRKKSAEEHGRDQTEQMNALFQWAQKVLKDAGLLKALGDAKTREELDAIKLDVGDPALIMAIRNALHPGAGKSRKEHFKNLNKSQLRMILRNRFEAYKKDEKEKLIASEQQTAAAEEAREKREENAKFYGEFKQYKVLDHGGVSVLITEELKTGESVPKWVQISRTRIDLLAVTRSRQESGPLTVWAGVPPGLFHILCTSKHGKSLASAIGQSVYGRPLIPNETVADPFGMSWLATANSIGQLILVRSSVGAFFEELNQGKAQDIADAAYRVANGISKTRMRGRDLEPRLTYCVPGFSTGEETMVDFLTRTGRRVTDGMRTRFADIPADVQPGTVFETFGADVIPELGNKYYPLLSKLYGAVGDAWLQVLVDLGPEKIATKVNHQQQKFRSRPRMQAIYSLAGPYQRSVVDRFATVAAACRLAIEAGLLWKDADTDADVEACVIRWADHERLNTIVAAIVQFMLERQSWKGTASQLVTKLNGAVDSPEALGRWLRKSENLQRLKLAGLEIAQGKDKTHNRSRLIRIGKIGVE